MGAPRRMRVLSWLRRHRAMLTALLLLQVVAYSYLFTLPLLTDHTFPNSWLYPYPSFKTTGEGRWLADLVILLQGGSGVPAVQMIAAAFLQAVNGILFTTLLGVGSGPAQFLLAGVLCLHPAFLDYYSFAADHLSFVLGDTCALLAAGVLLRDRSVPLRLAGAAGLNLLALGLYGPKVALILLLTLLVLLLRLVDAAEAAGRRLSLAQEIAVAGGAVALALLLFAASVRLLVRHPIFPSAQVNGLPQMAAAAIGSYARSLDYLSAMAGLPPGPLRWLPLVLVLLALVALAVRLRQGRWPQWLLAALLVLLLPIALNGAAIINDSSPTDRGRFVAAYAYLLVFCLSQCLALRRLRRVGLVAGALLFWLFLTLAVQQTQAFQFKSRYDFAIINRILVRLEPLLTTDAAASPQPVIVVGRYPPFGLESYVRWPGRIDAPHLLASDTFAPYRQTEMLNHLLGRSLLRRPSAAEIAHALPLLRQKEAWPAPESVFRDGRTVVVVLEPWRPDGAITWDDSR